MSPADRHEASRWDNDQNTLEPWFSVADPNPSRCWVRARWAVSTSPGRRRRGCSTRSVPVTGATLVRTSACGPMASASGLGRERVLGVPALRGAGPRRRPGAMRRLRLRAARAVQTGTVGQPWHTPSDSSDTQRGILMAILRTDIERVLDEIASQEEGMRFQGLA